MTVARFYTAVVVAALALPLTARAQSDPAKPAAGAATANTANLAGSWSGSLDTPQGAMATVCKLTKTANGYEGTMSGPSGDMPLTDISITGDTLWASATANMGGQSIALSYSFLIRSADELVGSVGVNFGGQAMSLPLTLKRVKEEE
jgi:hypothetical protein